MKSSLVDSGIASGPPILKVYNLDVITKTQEDLGISLKSIFKKERMLLNEIVDCELQLLGLNTAYALVKIELKERYKNNVVLGNASSNFAYQSISAINLIYDGYYGSAKTILRQFFEALVLAKFSEVDSTLVTKWENKTQYSRQNDIIISRDILKLVTARISKRGKNIDELSQMYSDLCDSTHPTKYSQQPLRIISSDMTKKERMRVLDEVIPGTRYSIDLIFTLLWMYYFFLIGVLAKNTRMGYKRYDNDALGNQIYLIQDDLKSKLEIMFKEYIKINRQYKLTVPTRWIKTVVSEYRQNWA